jgi:hypothetical protein
MIMRNGYEAARPPEERSRLDRLQPCGRPCNTCRVRDYVTLMLLCLSNGTRRVEEYVLGVCLWGATPPIPHCCRGDRDD